MSAAVGLTAALKMSFDHCAGRRSGSASAFSPDATIVSAMSCTTANGVSSYGPSQVSVSRMYSTCVSEWRVPLMKVTPETIGQAPCARTTSSAPIPLRTVTIVASGKRPSSARTAALEARRLRRDDRDVELRELGRIVRRGHLRLVLGLSGHAKAVLVERLRVFAASREHRDLAHAGQMTREETPDDARPDDADPFHAAPRVSQRGDMSVNRDCS